MNIWRFPQMGVDLYRWMVWTMEHPNQKWMITRGTPISGNIRMASVCFIFWIKLVE